MDPSSLIVRGGIGVSVALLRARRVGDASRWRQSPGPHKGSGEREHGAGRHAGSVVGRPLASRGTPSPSGNWERNTPYAYHTSHAMADRSESRRTSDANRSRRECPRRALLPWSVGAPPRHLWSAIITCPRRERFLSSSFTWLHEDNAVLDIRPLSRDNKSGITRTQRNPSPCGTSQANFATSAT